MGIRRPLAALLTTLTLLGGGATLTACEAAGQDQNDGTTDSGGDPDSGDTQEDTDQDSGGQDDPTG